MRFADRRSQIDSSGIRKVFELAANMKDPINLSIGMPDFDVPEAVKEAAIGAIQSGKNFYTMTAGTKELRAAIKASYEKRGYRPEDVLVTGGTSAALFLTMLVLLNPGDELMFADPYFVMYKHLSKFIGAKPVYVNTYPTFRYTREALEAAWTPKVKMLIVNTPSNPTGVVLTEEDCRMVAEFCDERGIALVCDEIYEHFSYDGPFASPARYAKEPIVISGMSKSVAMTGWRMGWTTGPAEFIKAMTEVQQYTIVCANYPAQEAALVALEHDMTATQAEYRKRRDRVYEGLVAAGYNVQKPSGAFYIFPEAPGGDGDAFVREAIGERLLLVPGSVFSERNSHFRISFSASMAKLDAGVEVLTRLAARHGVGAGR